MTPGDPSAHPLADELILDELFDLTLYQELSKFSRGDLKKILDQLVPVESRHLAFWQKFFKRDTNALDAGRRFKLRLLTAACRLFGPTAAHLTLEAIEIYGVRKYLAVWETYKNDPLGQAVREILNDEFEHEDAIVSREDERAISPESVRSIFLGFNDGLVEILGAVSGFFAAFAEARLVLMAGFTVATAGCLSMAAGAYAAGSSEREVRRIEEGKKRFLGQSSGTGEGKSAWTAAATVGVSYFFGAMVPVLPVAFGAHTALPSIAVGAVMVVLLSTVLGFLSGMRIRQRIGLNLAMVAGAVAVSYAIGTLVKSVWGIAL